MVAWNQYVVLFGGRSDSRVCNLIYVFNTINFTWKKYNNTYIDIADLQDETVDLVSGQVLVRSEENRKLHMMNPDFQDIIFLFRPYYCLI